MIKAKRSLFYNFAKQHSFSRQRDTRHISSKEENRADAAIQIAIVLAGQASNGREMFSLSRTCARGD